MTTDRADTEISQNADGTWHYNGLDFASYDDAHGTWLADRDPASAADDWQPGELELIYDGEDRDSLGYFITRYAATAEGSITRLAKSLGVSRQAVYDWMQCKSAPKLSLALPIMTALQIDAATYKRCVNKIVESQIDRQLASEPPS